MSIVKDISRLVRVSAQALLTLSLFTSVSLAQEIDKTKPYEMMKSVSESTFARLKAEKEQIRQQPDILKEVVEQELMPYVNYRYAALKVLGPNLKKAKKEDIPAFIEAFHQYLVTSYAQVLTLYSDQTIEFAPEKPIPAGKRIASIKLDVIDAPRPNIKLEFKLRKDKKSGEWKAFDMVAEGISLLSSKQSEWNGKIRKDGIPAVSEELQRLASQPIRFEGEQK
ncbi:phospholipid-binding protein MlaC [Vibrio hannami]|uniref:MlaC/ttg2D family ABC transporter substrate-binding protein n=1 Tax=Vibrio hannami TaxID=2717094 RepID=UPI00240FDEA3|nr:phospholipid-binding protein MlaC [Vibrio hannami]MDG3084761.1 phospholipid-binding protein MlaC [Vibrio hannami]